MDNTTLPVLTIGHICDLNLLSEVNRVAICWDDDLGAEGWMDLGFEGLSDIPDELKGIEIDYIDIHSDTESLEEFYVFGIWVNPSDKERNDLYEWKRRSNKANRRYIKNGIDENENID